MRFLTLIKLTVCTLQANLAVQEAKYESAMKDLNEAQSQLDEKQRELDDVRSLYDQAMIEKQASFAVVFTSAFVSEMTYTVSSGTLNSSIPYHTIPSPLHPPPSGEVYISVVFCIFV